MQETRHTHWGEDNEMDGVTVLRATHVSSAADI